MERGNDTASAARAPRSGSTVFVMPPPPHEHTSEGGRDDRGVPYHAESTLFLCSPLLLFHLVVRWGLPPAGSARCQPSVASGAKESGYIAAILGKMAGGQPFQPSTMAGAQSVQPSSGAWLVIIRWQPSTSPATRTNGCALVAPGLAGRMPSAAV